MERTKLSSSQILIKIFLIVLSLYLLITLLNHFSIVLLLFGVLFIGFISYVFFYISDKVQFDEENMYIIYRDGETVVPLKDVYYVSRSRINTNSMGIIRYRYEVAEYFAHYNTRYFSKSFSKFTAAVMNENPRSVIDENFF